MNFNKRGHIAKNCGQDFDREKIFIEKAGKKINVYDAIQAANIDTEIYEVMKKYNCVENEASKLMEERGGMKGIYADLSVLMANAQTLGDIMNINKKAEQMFNELPSEIREKYGQNLEQFLIDVETSSKKLEKQKEQIKENAENDKQ